MMIKKMKGFTLIELMVVVAIIGILATISLPSYKDYVVRSEVTEALGMASDLKANIKAFYKENLRFPINNSEAGLPDASKLIGNRITSVTIEDGAIHIALGNKASQPLQGKMLSFTPTVVDGSPESPIAWLCGYDSPVVGMSVVGDNFTDINSAYLPHNCR